MAETAVSASKGVIGALFEKLTKLVEDKCTNLVGMSKNIVFLKDELPTMSALLEKLEDADELDPVVKAWRNQVREMAYDIEDCIDDFVHHVGGGDVEAGFIDKVSHFLRTLRARLETAEHIKDLKIQLIEINERHKRYKFDLDDTPSSSFVAIDPRLPALYSEAANLVGIEGPREQVIKWLTDADQQIMVLPIVGFGGLGKTTLAKEVYQKIGQQFNTTEFVSVSQRPDVTRFLKGIQSKLPIRLSSEYCEVKDIIDNIRAYLQHRRPPSPPRAREDTEEMIQEGAEEEEVLEPDDKEADAQEQGGKPDFKTKKKQVPVQLGPRARRPNPRYKGDQWVQ